MKKLFLAVATFFVTTLDAHIIPQPCSIALEAEWLYWIAYGNLSSFAERTNTFSSQPDTTSTDFNNIFNYRSAFRIIGSCSLNSCNFLEARFTYFNSDHTRTIRQEATPNEVLIASFGFPYQSGEVSSKIALKYYAGDLVLKNFPYQKGGLQVEFFEGLHYFWSEVNQSISSQGIHAFTEQFATSFSQTISQTWAIGPEFGADFNYMLPFFCFNPCNQLSFIGNIRAMVLVSHHKPRNISIRTTPTQTGIQRQNFDPAWQVIPGIDVYLGFEWLRVLNCWSVYVEVGYECVSYPNGIMKPFSSNNFNLLGFHGPYASFGINF